MPDNLGYTPGAGATVAADDIGGVAFQRIKVAIGADGTNDGDVSSANPLPVTGAVTQSGAWTVGQSGSPWGMNLTQYGSVAVGTANAIHVQPGTGASFLTTNANIDVALSTRLKPADTLTGVTTVGAVTSITNALPAGTNLMGKVGIDQTTPGTTNAVAVTNSFLLDATFTGRINTQGQKTMATSTPVVLASDQAAIPVTVSTSALPSNAATETGNLALLYANETQNTLPTLLLLLTELRVISSLLQVGLSVQEAPESFRNDPSILQ